MIRFLALFCGVLIVANVALFLWPSAAHMAPHIHAPRADINAHFVRLNKEVEEKYQAKKIEQQVAALVTDVYDEDACYRLGPFMHPTNFDLAEAVLFNANVKFKKSTRESKSSEVYRVYIGPFQSKAEADDAKVELKRKNVLDHFLRREKPGRFIVSLGIYTTSGSANNAILLFDGKLDNVKVQQEMVVLPSTSWFHFKSLTDDGLQRQLSRMDWGEQSAKIGKFDCLD